MASAADRRGLPGDVARGPSRRRNELRETVRAAAPGATETIAYNMPAFRSHGGQFLVSFAAFRAHYSLFPASEQVVEELGDELAPYLAGRGRSGSPRTSLSHSPRVSKKIVTSGSPRSRSRRSLIATRAPSQVSPRPSTDRIENEDRDLPFRPTGNSRNRDTSRLRLPTRRISRRR